MVAKYKLLTALLPLALVCFLRAGVPQRQSGTESFPSMSTAIDAIATKYNVRVGVEYAQDDSDRFAIAVDLSTPNPVAAFNSLIAQKPEYTWSLSEGVYDLHPKSRSGSLLDVNIQTFSLNRATPEQISVTIDNLPEVKTWLATHHVRRRELDMGSTSGASAPRITLSLSDITVRTILNRIILESGRTRWTVIRYGNKGQYIGIYA